MMSPIEMLEVSPGTVAKMVATLVLLLLFDLPVRAAPRPL